MSFKLRLFSSQLYVAWGSSIEDIEPRPFASAWSSLRVSFGSWPLQLRVPSVFVFVHEKLLTETSLEFFRTVFTQSGVKVQVESWRFWALESNFSPQMHSCLQMHSSLGDSRAGLASLLTMLVSGCMVKETSFSMQRTVWGRGSESKKAVEFRITAFAGLGCSYFWLLWALYSRSDVEGGLWALWVRWPSDISLESRIDSLL